MKPTFFDRLKIGTFIDVRYVYQATTKRWPKRTCYRNRKPINLMPQLVLAKEHDNCSDIPSALWVPKKIPKESKLGLLYPLPHSFLTGGLFKLFLKYPIIRGVRWILSLKINQTFLKNKESWGEVNCNFEFAQLRLRGTNPFLLKQINKTHLVLDHTPFFKTFFESIKCAFKLGCDQFLPKSIAVGNKRYQF